MPLLRLLGFKSALDLVNTITCYFVELAIF